MGRMKSIAVRRIIAFAIDYFVIVLFIALLLTVNLLFLTKNPQSPDNLIETVFGQTTAFLSLTRTSKMVNTLVH